MHLQSGELASFAGIARRVFVFLPIVAAAAAGCGKDGGDLFTTSGGHDAGTTTEGAGGGSSSSTATGSGAGGGTSTSTSTTTSGSGGAAPSCTDGVRNGGETGVDCGGPCATKCAIGEGCGVAGDCSGAAVCAEGKCRVGTSCGEINAAKPGLGNGGYTIDPDLAGPVQPFDVWCDMQIDGGGWTLVGRTKPGGNPAALNNNGSCLGNDAGDNFGWQLSQGSITDDNAPYSLGVTSHALAFTQVLVGDYSSGKTWGAAAYRFNVPNNYVTAYTNSDFPVTVTTVLGSCSNPPMLSHAGYTAWNSAFHLRDLGQPGWGLYSSGFFLCADDCYGGNLNAKQGMIFVR